MTVEDIEKEQEKILDEIEKTYNIYSDVSDSVRKRFIVL